MHSKKITFPDAKLVRKEKIFLEQMFSVHFLTLYQSQD